MGKATLARLSDAVVDRVEILVDRVNFLLTGVRSGQVWQRLDVKGDTLSMAWGVWGGVCEVADEVRSGINAMCLGLEPWQIIAYTLGTLSLIIYANHFLQAPESMWERLRKWVFKQARKIPFVKAKIAQEVAKARVDIEHTIHSADKKGIFQKYLPDKGLSKGEIATLTDEYGAMSRKFEEGQISGTVYGGDPEVTVILTEVFGKTAWTNPLHPDVFPGIRKMEAEVVRMTLNMYHGGPTACGCMSSGGTESLLLVCLSYRNRAYENGIHDPEMLIPVTAHAAFDKAGSYFNIRVRHVPVDPATQKCDVAQMKRMISSKTCMLVASSPDFAHGTMDPIEEIAKLGETYGIPVHVDACLGGFLVPFMELAGTPPPHMFDFRVPGVSSISADTHKGGGGVERASGLCGGGALRRLPDPHRPLMTNPAGITSMIGQ